MVMGLVSGLSLANHTDLESFRVLPDGARLVQPGWMPERRIPGGGRTGGVSFWPFRNSSGWWRLISSLFLTRPSCPKTTHANSYYGAWPGWAVSISVLPLTLLDFWWIQESFSPGTCYGSVWCVSRCSGAGWCGEAVLWFSRKSWVSRTLISGLALPCTSFLQWSRATLLIAVNSSSMKQWY